MHQVYDVSKFAEQHPGGEVIYTHAGRDGTDIFTTFHASTTWKTLQDFYIGDLKVSPKVLTVVIASTTVLIWEIFFCINRIGIKLTWKLRCVVRLESDERTSMSVSIPVPHIHTHTGWDGTDMFTTFRASTTWKLLQECYIGDLELSSKYLMLVNKTSPAEVMSFCIRGLIEWGSGTMLLLRAEEVDR